jgi:hypothetical protein
VTANKATFPAEMTVPFHLVNWALATESSEILTAALLQVLAEIVLELTLIAKAAFLWRKLIVKHSSRAKRQGVARASKCSTSVLAALLLFVFLASLALASTIACITLVITIVCGFSCIIINNCILGFSFGISAMDEVSMLRQP